MRRVLIAITLALMLTLPLASKPATAQAGRDGQALNLPRVLSDADAARYRRIFRLQRTARWRAADREIKQLTDRLLMGHVLSQRYLHSCCYRSRYRELRPWMSRYADHPQARRIYRLALRRKPRRARRPRRPVNVGEAAGIGARPSAIVEPGPRLNRRQRKSARYLKRLLKRRIRRGRLKSASKILRRRDVVKLFGKTGYDRARLRLAVGRYRIGQDERAYQLASASAARSGARVPFAHWTAGLAAWRLGRSEIAAGHFEALSKAAGISGWNRSAAGYWAARAHLASSHPERVNQALLLAAKHKRTFYGLLARRTLGLETKFDWTQPPAQTAALGRLVREPTMRRALALLQAGQTGLAEFELRRLYRGGDRAMAQALLAIASARRMPGLAMRVASTLVRVEGKAPDGALYPLPDWRPRQGFILDRALIFAVMRQESAFNTRAKSYAGARGLMQLMPRTASLVAGDRSLRRRKRDRLFEPRLNIDLGQQYLHFLLAQDYIRGNLFYTVAGYNAGPHRVAKWQAKVNYRNDPLLFIESIPFRQTRIYIERVLANLWIYRKRLGQPTPSLDAIAAGRWPKYKSLDGTTGSPTGQ